MLQDRNLSIEPLVGAHDCSEWVLLGESVAVRQLRLQIRRVAPYFRTALIRGEAGAGKELVARAIHALSPGFVGPFIVADARLLAESTEYCESPHANTTLTAARLLASAQGGTLYLTHIGDSSTVQQAALLAFLRDCEERKGTWPRPGNGISGEIGGREVQVSTSRNLDMRILAASDRDLRSLAAIGQFRQDLFARLSGLEIFVPPLRQRVADIPILVDCLLRRIAEGSGEPAKSLAERAMLWLQEYSWPNNFCELKHVVIQAATFAEGGTIEASHLLALIEPQVAQEPMSAPPKIECLHDVMQRHVLDVLSRCAGNKVRAAEALGISRSTLYRMLGVRNEG